MEKTKFEWMNKLESNVLIGLSNRQEIEDYITELQFQFKKQQSEINRLRERENHLKYSLDNALKQNKFDESERKNHLAEINRLKEEFIPPSDVEILLYSSSNEVYVNDDQRIGFQKGAKWMRKQLSQNKQQ